MHIEKLFFSYMKKIQIQFNSAISIAMKTDTIGTLSHNDAVSEQVIRDKLFKRKAHQIFRSVRNSPKYWEDKKKNLNAMIRQLGPPTFFITLSPAETYWPELIRILLRIHKRPNEDDYSTVSDEILLALNQNKLLALIAHDPVTVARYVENRMGFLRNFIFNTRGPFVENPVVDKVWRTLPFPRSNLQDGICTFPRSWLISLPYDGLVQRRSAL